MLKSKSYSHQVISIVWNLILINLKFLYRFLNFKDQLPIFITQNLDL